MSLHSSSEACKFPVPLPSLSSQYKVLGGFDQAYDANSRVDLQDAAQQAAAVQAASLGQVQTNAPIMLIGIGAARYDSLVVPLSAAHSAVATGGGKTVIGLVDFLRDCQNRAYFSQVVTFHQHTQFPFVTMNEAKRKLGVDRQLQLAYESSPFAPIWYDPISKASVPAI